MTMRQVLPLAVLLSLATAAAQLQLQDAYEIPGENTFPEGIAYLAAEEIIFVTGAVSGGIYRVDLASGEAATLLEPGQRAPFTTIGLALDADGRLWVAGGGSGEILRFDDPTGAEATEPSVVITTLPAQATFLNDLVVAPNGDVFVTDSQRPTLFRVPAGGDEAEEWLDFTGTELEYVEGFNLNGIAVTEDGRHLIVVQSNTGRLYRVAVESQEVALIELDGDPVHGGDGLVLVGLTLYVVQNGPDVVAVVTLSDDLLQGTTLRHLEDERLTNAATAALVGDSLLVVGAQFGRQQTGPELPFLVVVVPVE